MLAEQLNKLWLARRGAIAIDALMRFTDEGLVLGAGTVLAPAGESPRDIAIDPAEPRLLALLTAAHLGRPTDGALAHLRRAATCWRERQDALAAIHLVLSRIDRLEQPEADAHRLFLADGMLLRGADADAIIDAIESGPSAVEQLQKYSPEQPRVPAGSGRTSGQWTGDNDTQSAPTGMSARRDSPLAPQAPPLPTSRAFEFPFHPSACRTARNFCGIHAYESAPVGPTAANDNDPPFKEKLRIEREILKRVKSCIAAEGLCDLVDVVVYSSPLPITGFTRFPDGGVVVIRKGDEEGRYFPPGAPIRYRR